MRIDLHTHSSVSDGTESPGELLATARAAGLDVVALTDHDTTAGWSVAEAARPAGLTVVPGMEMSCRWFPDDQPPISVHLLAYLFDPTHPAFAAERGRLRDERLERGNGSWRRSPAPGTRCRGSGSSSGPRAAWWGARTSPARSSRPGPPSRSTTPSRPCCTTAAPTT
ncbi:PHP domain-containing protein [Blastococcus brunescens]|uniref:PHP domain-containing protein n=1 Tax=Blastococcus brunescens TaxID=1564165 RepID=A0ABZ1B8R3_9ACTN|nr:PHP domain-containing protein [Blastococcus sp. BMG 8361]WRL67124.1 PHP domain-containing protein [Blastococcus sp. BMG 8361]